MEAPLLLLLLALQFGLQPLLQRPLSAVRVRTTAVFVQELAKALLCCVALLPDHAALFHAALLPGFVRSSLATALLPALLYTVQNWLANLSGRYLDPLSWSIINQTKTLSAAFFSWILLGRKQSRRQLFALTLLFGAAILLSFAQISGNGEKGIKNPELSPPHNNIAIIYGVIPLGIASLLSGFSAVLSEIAFKTRTNVFVYSLELSVYGMLVILASIALGLNPDVQSLSEVSLIFSNGTLFDGWTIGALIPVVTNALGGILVGAVTKYAGSVRKGFALIGGICLTAVFQSTLAWARGQEGDDAIVVTSLHMYAALLTIGGMYLHMQPGPGTTKPKEE